VVDFNDIMDAIQDGTDLEGQPDAKAEERVTPEDSLEETKPVGEPESEVKVEEEAPEGTPPEDAAEGTEEEPVPDTEATEPTFQLGEEQVTLSQIQKWRKEAEDGGLRLSDYTRKTTEASEVKRKALALQQSTATLADDIAKDPSLTKFLSARPDALGYLMKDPEATRSLLGNPKGVEDFWGAFDAIKDNPILAEKFLQSEPTEAEAMIREQSEADNVNAIVGTLDMTIDAAAEKFFPQVDPEEVKAYVASLAGMPPEPTHQDWVKGADRLYHLFFRTVDGKAELVPQLLELEFARLQARAGKSPEGASPLEKVDEHNAAVDRQLSSEAPPPKTPGGKPPVAEPEPPRQYKDFQEILRDI